MQKDFSYLLAVDDLSGGESVYKLKADTRELVFLKELLKVEDVKSFEAVMKLKLDKKKHVLTVKGNVKADVELKSVVSLENFVKSYDTDFEVVMDTKPSKESEEEEELEFDDEIVDAVEDGKVDLVHIATEQLALVLDDYPRKEGEVFSFKAEFEENEKKNPFEILAKLK